MYTYREHSMVRHCGRGNVAVTCAHDVRDDVCRASTVQLHGLAVVAKRAEGEGVMPGGSVFFLFLFFCFLFVCFTYSPVSIQQTVEWRPHFNKLLI